MALTPEIRVTKGASLAAAQATAGENRVTKGAVLAAVNFPSVEVRITQAAGLAAGMSIAQGTRVSQGAGLIAASGPPPLRVSQAAVLVAAKGRVANPRLRAWTFSLDGHDFYVLRLGEIWTLVYDVYSEQWMDWDGFEEIYWPLNTGINWVGGIVQARAYGSNVLVGDDSYGLIYFLNPDLPYDESPDGPTDPVPERYFERVVQGQVPMTGRQVLPCYAVWLTTDMGAPAYDGAGVTLEISDDGGVTYDDMGTIDVTLGENSPELFWGSLGQIGAPGRLFRITDDGAIARIDNMEMNDPDDK